MGTYVGAHVREKRGYAGSTPPVVRSFTPITGPHPGGTIIDIEVNDSVGATGATVGGLPLLLFVIVDATHVRGTTPAMPIAQEIIAVTSVNATSPNGTGTAQGRFNST